ncbi:MAG TPA: hypothetical protein VG125_20800 [Pirellulales bacterium]|jgi:hypothetical protein|nr:hypothetical protein [Pirellulales bacterium]
MMESRHTSPFHRTTDEIARDLVTALPPRRPCIEVVDPVMAQVLRQKTEWERLEIATGMWRSARRILQATIQQENPNWTPDQVDREAARRMSHGLV